MHLGKREPEKALVVAWNNLVQNKDQIMITPEDDCLQQYRKRQLMVLIEEYGTLDDIPYQLTLKVLDHIRVEADHLEVVYLTGIMEKIALVDLSKYRMRRKRAWNDRNWQGCV
jgi:hypothetical protein